MSAYAAADEHSVIQYEQGHAVAAAEVGDLWHKDCVVSQLPRGDEGVLANKDVPRGEIIIRAGGVVADCGSDPFPLYHAYLEELAQS